MSLTDDLLFYEHTHKVSIDAEYLNSPEIAGFYSLTAMLLFFLSDL